MRDELIRLLLALGFTYRHTNRWRKSDLEASIVWAHQQWNVAVFRDRAEVAGQQAKVLACTVPAVAAAIPNRVQRTLVDALGPVV